MHATPKSHRQLRIANATFVVLFLAAIGLLQWLAREHNLRFDWTETGRHTLSEASRAAAERLRGPLKITAFASKRDDTRSRIQGLLARYRQFKPDIELRFVDPDEAPDEVRAAGVRQEGELLLQHADASERIAAPARLDEESFTNALTRLGHRGERWIVFLTGHGERGPERQGNFDLSSWTTELRKRGFQARSLALAELGQIPQNTSVFVIASPRTRLLPGEVKTIQRYIGGGGNLLWLSDPGPLQGLEPLAEMLGLEFLPGTVVDPLSEAATGSAAAVVVANYGSHPIVRDFLDSTLFPQAGALHLAAPQGWQGTALIDTRPSAWLETSALREPIAFDKGKDLRGPLTLAVALSREPDKFSASEPTSAGARKRDQRIVVVADGDFLSNQFLANAGNLDFGLSLANWLSQNDDYVSIPVRVARDRSLELSHGMQLALVAVFFIGLPLALIGAGVWVWRRRRRR